MTGDDKAEVLALALRSAERLVELLGAAATHADDAGLAVIVFEPRKD